MVEDHDDFVDTWIEPEWVGEMEEENKEMKKLLREFIECIQQEWGPIGDPDNHPQQPQGIAMRASKLLENSK